VALQKTDQSIDQTVPTSSIMENITLVLIFNYYVMLKRSSFKNTEAEITSVEYWLIHQLAWSNERAFAWRIRDARTLLITLETITYMPKKLMTV